VKAYVKRNKNDAADPEAICEAVRTPDHAFCADQIGRTAGPFMQIARADVLNAAHPDHQRLAGASGRARHVAQGT
jgi:transposase